MVIKLIALWFVVGSLLNIAIGVGIVVLVVRGIRAVLSK